jgi:hypothetical protein
VNRRFAQYPRAARAISSTSFVISEALLPRLATLPDSLQGCHSDRYAEAVGDHVVHIAAPSEKKRLVKFVREPDSEGETGRKPRCTCAEPDMQKHRQDGEYGDVRQFVPWVRNKSHGKRGAPEDEQAGDEQHTCDTARVTYARVAKVEKAPGFAPFTMAATLFH